jgi:hypothetical protein
MFTIDFALTGSYQPSPWRKPPRAVYFWSLIAPKTIKRPFLVKHYLLQSVESAIKVDLPWHERLSKLPKLHEYFFWVTRRVAYIVAIPRKLSPANAWSWQKCRNLPVVFCHNTVFHSQCLMALSVCELQVPQHDACGKCWLYHFAIHFTRLHFELNFYWQAAASIRTRPATFRFQGWPGCHVQIICCAVANAGSFYNIPIQWNCRHITPAKVNCHGV